MRRRLLSLVPALVLAASLRPAAAAQIPSPSEFLRIPVGADRTLADYRQIVSYFRMLDAASPRVELVTIGKTTLGEDLVMAVISSEENLAGQARIREVARRLADPRGLTDAEAERLVGEGKAVLLVTCAIHATEVGSTQMAMEWAHALATAEDAETRRRLSSVVLLLVPSLNPDGNLMEVDWYRKHIGTRWEGGRMPWLYHPYVGHDNNRDFFMLTQKESQALNRVLYHDWCPQVFLDEHQMGSAGPRIFVPPYAEPVDPDIHPLVWREVNLIGTEMALRLEQAGKPGVIYGYSFDAYWIGGTKNTGWWKNVSGLLTEVASARMATPVFVPETELRGGAKGLVAYDAQTNFPNPWPGGWWRLRDVMDYDRIASDALLEACASHREDFLRDMLARARSAIALARPGEGFLIPRTQRDPAAAYRLADLLAEHRVDVAKAPSGDLFVPLDQPYGRFVREMLGTQRFPEVKLVAGKEAVRPYDVSAWSLPLMMGVEVRPATAPPAGLVPFAKGDRPARAAAPGREVLALPAGSPDSFRIVAAALKAGAKVSRLHEAADAGGTRLAAGTFLLDASAAKAVEGLVKEAGASAVAVAAVPSQARLVARAPRVGLYKPWAASMDEGWTRWVLEQYGLPPVSLDNETIRKGKLAEKVDVIVLPSVEKEVITSGKPRREEGDLRYFPELPPPYAGGLEKEGARGLRDFVEAGGTLVALAESTAWAIDELALPVRNVLARVKADDFSCPGSILRVRVLAEHPVTWGLGPEVAAFVDGTLAFQTVNPGAEMERWVLAGYPRDGRDVLLSGWIHGEERIARQAAVVATTLGKGKVVLFGFRAQHRAQTHATFPLLFNSLFWAVEGR